MYLDVSHNNLSVNFLGQRYYEWVSTLKNVMMLLELIFDKQENLHIIRKTWCS